MTYLSEPLFRLWRALKQIEWPKTSGWRWFRIKSVCWLKHFVKYEILSRKRKFLFLPLGLSEHVRSIQPSLGLKHQLDWWMSLRLSYVDHPICFLMTALFLRLSLVNGKASLSGQRITNSECFVFQEIIQHTRQLVIFNYSSTLTLCFKIMQTMLLALSRPLSSFRIRLAEVWHDSRIKFLSKESMNQIHEQQQLESCKWLEIEFTRS